MRTLFTDIGLVTASPHSHLARLASIEKDPSGGGGSTSTIEDEHDDETPEEKAAREEEEEQARLNEDGDERGSRRSRETAAYRELQSDRDKTRRDLEEEQRKNRELETRLNTLETETRSRKEVNERTNEALDRASQRARQVSEAVSKIDANDPDRTAKIYTEIYKPFYEDLPKIAEEISDRRARDTFREERSLEERQAEAKKVTLDALEKAGLEPEDFELVEALAIRKAQRDPNWFKETPQEDQIPELVGIVKDRIVKTKRHSKEFQEENTRHRRPMSGVIDGGSRTARRRETEEEEDRDEGLGSILADLARSKEEKRKSTNGMMRSAEFGR